MLSAMAGDASVYGSNMASHMPHLQFLARHWSWDCVVELGVGRGWSTLALAYGVLQSGTGHAITSYDLNPKAGEKVRALLPQELLKSWKFEVSDSRKAAGRYADGTVSLLFLDTSHTFKDTLEELEAWTPKLHPQGVLCGHDYLLHEHPDWRSTSGVKQAVDLWKPKMPGHAFYLNPADFGLFVFFPRVP